MKAGDYLYLEQYPENLQWMERRSVDRHFDILYHFIMNSGSPARSVLYMNCAPELNDLKNLPANLPPVFSEFVKLALESSSQEALDRMEASFDRGHHAFDATEQPLDFDGIYNPYVKGTAENVWWSEGYETALREYLEKNPDAVYFTFDDDGRYVDVNDPKLFDIGNRYITGEYNVRRYQSIWNRDGGRWRNTFVDQDKKRYEAIIWWQTSVDDKTGGEARIIVRQNGIDVQRSVMCRTPLSQMQP